MRWTPGFPGEQRPQGLDAPRTCWGPARGAPPEPGRGLGRAEPSGNGQTAAKEDVGGPREAVAAESGVPRLPRWDRALLAVTQSGPERLLGLARRLSTAAPCPDGSAEHRQLGTLWVCVPAPLGWCCCPLLPAPKRPLALRLSGTTLNYKGCDYNNISPPCSACSGVKGSALERVLRAAIHKGS